MNCIALTVRHSLSGELKGRFFELLQFLSDQEKEVFLCPLAKKVVKNSTRFSDLPEITDIKKADLFLFFGGDGTILRNINRFAPDIFSVPLFGINAGNLGFFSSLSSHEIQKGLPEVFSGKYSKDERMVLSGEIRNKEGEIKHSFSALNECVIHHAGVARLRKITAEVSDESLTTYRADGLIIATSTGSTAYNLAAGGPILAASMEGFILTPLAPAGFSQRPIVLPPHKKLSFTCDGDMLLSIDGQQYFDIESTDTVHIKKNPIALTFLRLEKERYFANLREKLGWG